MACWCRVGQSKLRLLSTQFRRCYIQLPNASLLNSITSNRKPRVTETPYWVLHSRPTDVCYNVRFFAAPVQAKTKKYEWDTGEPRMNEDITARFVRLVIDDGHSVVSRDEALARARMLKLDLVEVQRNANPPVCKIMDYHKERYKQQEREKERAKIKSELSLRKGPPKEMRISAKTELKDLKMKAEMVKKLMEKGYRVKCRVSGNEDQDLEGIVSRFSALIEDVSIVESGPHLAKKEAYVIVRHVKFGQPKKGGVSKKKLQDAGHAQEASDSNEEDQNQLSAESESETEEEVLFDGDKHVSHFMGREPEPPAMTENRYKRNTQPSIGQELPTLTENRYKRNNSPPITREPPAVTENWYKRTDPMSRNNFPSRAQEPPVVTDNRYKRTDPTSRNNFPSRAQEPPVMTDNRYKRTDSRIRFQQTSAWDNTGLNNRGAGIRDSSNSISSVLDQNRQARPDTNVNIKAGEIRHDVISGSRNSMPSHEDIPKGGLSRPGADNAPRSSYGLFSATKGHDTTDARTGLHRNREGVSHDSAQHFGAANLRRGVQ